MQVSLMGMCVYWEEEVVERGLSRKSQCDAMSLLLSMKLGTICSLTQNYSATIFERLTFWNWRKCGATKCNSLYPFNSGNLPFSVPPISHHSGCRLPEQRVGSERSLTLGPHHEDYRWAWDKGSCKSYLKEVKSLMWSSAFPNLMKGRT